MMGRFADWFNSRRWFIRYLLYAEWVLGVTFFAFVAARSGIRSKGQPVVTRRFLTHH